MGCANLNIIENEGIEGLPSMFGKDDRIAQTISARLLSKKIGAVSGHYSKLFTKEEFPEKKTKKPILVVLKELFSDRSEYCFSCFSKRVMI